MAGSIYIGRGDARYPGILERIPGPPAGLYCRGNTELLDTFGIGVVGTRLASDYGRRAAADFAGALAADGITVVSGMALGIDAVAHRAALDIRGRTIAVLGTGIDNLWPRENERLGERIIAEGGLVVSEMPGVKPGARHTFPQRNRIIAGLCRGILVVEADLKSGSLITAKCALEQGRDVFAVPGSIYWPRSAGTNWLIAQGAHPVREPADILEYYRGPGSARPTAVSTSDPDQAGILAVLRTGGPATLDALAAAVGGEPSRTIATVALMELRGLVRPGPGGTYTLP